MNAVIGRAANSPNWGSRSVSASTCRNISWSITNSGCRSRSKTKMGISCCSDGYSESSSESGAVSYSTSK